MFEKKIMTVVIGLGGSCFIRLRMFFFFGTVMNFGEVFNLCYDDSHYFAG